jgi:CheY-like chemotaxis protein
MPARHALVVDDDADGRDGVAQLLEAHGYKVRQAENGRVALDMIAERIPCLVVLDLDMPVMNGWEVLAWIRHDRRCGAMAVVVLSAAASSPPDVAFVRKPCEIEQLLEAIRGCDGRGPGQSPGPRPER